MTEQNDSLETLMRRPLTGKQRTYASLLHETTRLLRPFLAKRLSIANEVNDLMQEILLSIHKARHTYDGNRPYTSRVYAIAKFRLQDHLRVHSTNCAMPLISASLKNICLSLFLPMLVNRSWRLMAGKSAIEMVIF